PSARPAVPCPADRAAPAAGGGYRSRRGCWRCAAIDNAPQPLFHGAPNAKESGHMARPVTLFTGQWADLPFETICQKARQFGYDGLELAVWGDHFDIPRALKDPGYCKQRWEVLKDNGLTCYAISAHLIGQCICDNIDERHKAILPEEVWGDGDPEGVRQRAAQRLIDAAKAARLMRDAAPEKIDFPAVVNGFTGSSVWHSLYAFPPTDQAYW